VQAARLRAVGCPLDQGYLFSRPVDAAGVERLLYGRLAA
jgi:EAL domain-containing protein (putative c-di-GMP-specific phosphodiesterase class I)